MNQCHPVREKTVTLQKNPDFLKWSRAIVMIFKKLNKKERSPIAPLRSTSTWPLHTGSSPIAPLRSTSTWPLHTGSSPIAPLRSTSTWPLHTGSSPNRIPLFLKGDIHCCNTTDMNLGDTNIFLNITCIFFYILIILYMLNQIYIHNITTLFDKWRMTNENNMCSKIGWKYQTCLMSSDWMKSSLKLQHRSVWLSYTTWFSVDSVSCNLQTGSDFPQIVSTWSDFKIGGNRGNNCVVHSRL